MFSKFFMSLFVLNSEAATNEPVKNSVAFPQQSRNPFIKNQEKYVEILNNDAVEKSKALIELNMAMQFRPRPSFIKLFGNHIYCCNISLKCAAKHLMDNNDSKSNARIEKIKLLFNKIQLFVKSFNHSILTFSQNLKKMYEKLQMEKECTVFHEIFFDIYESMHKNDQNLQPEFFCEIPYRYIDLESTIFDDEVLGSKVTPPKAKELYVQDVTDQDKENKYQFSKKSMMNTFNSLKNYFEAKARNNYEASKALASNIKILNVIQKYYLNLNEIEFNNFLKDRFIVFVDKVFTNIKSENSILPSKIFEEFFGLSKENFQELCSMILLAFKQAF